ncbi:DUF3135 domain-containing protein [Teredinibacter haidensis]|uniref:DUF3135 domain-containing protein n=1 Tax=Teredinibacter haidensis TaxID=2731755 RepID=UPI000948BC77|nr:DUF3135 domain-containing protein [Teredinibacter haidensis]
MKNWPDINQLLRMAKDSPEELETFRLRQIEALITATPKDMQRRLRGLQFQIDCQRKLHKSSMGACIAISRMMHESVNQLSYYLNGKNSALKPDQPNFLEEDETGKILPFPA